MRKSDLSARKQATCKPVPGHSGQFALTPDPAPATIPHTGNEAMLALASTRLEHLDQQMQALPYRQQVLALLSADLSQEVPFLPAR